MDESEKLTALKKAYADIILNTAKEAAARILVSEKRALRYQRELFSSKNEAFRMLLRLKQMLDSQAGEAKTMSLSQQRKIDELEAQLQEAEDIVKDLREELSEVQAQLEKAINNQAQPIDRKDMEVDIAAPALILPQLSSQLNVVAPYEKNSISNGTYEGSRYDSANGTFRDHYYIQNPDFASIIMRRKEPELFRNGCTQRICAFERNLLDEKLSLSGLADDAKTATFIRADDEGERLFKMPKPAVGKTHGVENSDELQEDDSCIQAPAFKSFQKKRKRATRCRRSKPPSSRDLPHLSMELRQVSDLARYRTSASSVNDSVLTENASTKSQDEIRNVTASPLTGKLLTDTTEISTQSGCANITVNDVEFVRSASTVQKATSNDKIQKRITGESKFIGQESSFAQSVEVLACKADVEIDNKPLDMSNAKASDLDDGTASQPVNNNFLKYTFCRKRKKETLRSLESKSLLDNDSLERKAAEEPYGLSDPHKSSLLNESSRESRRLAQVARQLISLSEKKWRQ